MTYTLLTHNWWPIQRQRTERAQVRSAVERVDRSDNSFYFDSNDAVAIIAYVEALNHMAIEPELVDTILQQELATALAKSQGHSDTDHLDSIAQDLLPKAKELRATFYAASTKSVANCDDILHSVHEECDIQLFKSLSRIYARNFIEKYFYSRLSH